MPHLCVETYFTQYFWLVVILFSFYYIAVNQIIPKFSETFKTRKKLESLAIDTQSSDEESPAAKHSALIISNSIAGSKTAANINIDSAKYSSHFKNSNKEWINKTLG